MSRETRVVFKKPPGTPVDLVWSEKEGPTLVPDMMSQPTTKLFIFPIFFFFFFLSSSDQNEMEHTKMTDGSLVLPQIFLIIILIMRLLLEPVKINGHTNENVFLNVFFFFFFFFVWKFLFFFFVFFFKKNYNLDELFPMKGIRWCVLVRSASINYTERRS